jgi:zinc transport system substrate-binding protein
MKKFCALLGVLPMLLVLTACGGEATSNGGPSVVASFYPFAYVAEQVGGSLVDVTNLTSPGVEPHDLELKPRQVGSVQDADVVVYEKHFQSAVDEAVDQADRSGAGTLDVADELTLKPTQDGAEGDHDEQDPHTWLDPQNMITVARSMQTKLAAIDPDHAADYAANATAFIAELDRLDRDFAAGLATCRTRTIVTSHAAFQYLADRYDLTQVPIAGIDPANEPSPAQLGEITRLVDDQKITTIFTEELVSPAIARTIADETGATTATLDPIEGLSDGTKDETYLTLMRANLESLRKASSCTP